MVQLVMSVQGKGIKDLERATRVLGSKKSHRGFSMAINRTGRKGFTQVKRAVSKQAGLTQKKTIRYGNINQQFANPGKLAHKIISTGGEVPLKAFKARETRKGVKASPFGKRQLFDGTFIKSGWWPNRRGAVGNGHVFTPDTSTNRAGRPFSRTPSGVRIPQQIVIDESKAAFERNAASLPKNINHIITRMTKGVIS